MSDQLGEAQIPIRATLDKLDGDLSEAKGKIEKALGGVRDTVTKLGTAALVGVGAAIVGVAVAGANQFIDFQNSLNEVFTLLPGMSADAMDEMSDDVLKFSKDFAVLPDEVIPALYQSISAGVPPDNVFSFLETAQKAAVGGVTDLETAVDGITSVVNAYGEEVLDAAEASDLMFTTAKLGKTDFGQLSKSLFNVIPTAASLGVSFGDVSAQLAVLTAQGTPTSVATTQIRSALVEASKGGTKLSNAIGELTGSSFTELIEQGKTVPEIFNELRESMSDQEFKDLFGSVEAMNAALGVTGPNFEGVSAAMDEMNDSSGALDAAYETMNDSIQRSKDRFKAFASVALIKVGKALSPVIDKVLALGEQALPFVEEALTVVTGVMDSFFGNLEEGMSPLDSFIEAIWDIAPQELLDGLVRFRDEILPGVVTWLENLWTAVQPVVETIKTAVTEFVSWQDVMIGVALAIGAIVIPIIWGILSPILAVIAVGVLLVAAVALIRTAWENNWGGIQEKTAVVGAFLQDIFAQIAAWVKTVLMPVVAELWNKWVTVWWPAISAALTNAWNNVILPALTALWAFITNVIVPTIADLWNKWVTIWWPAISQALSDAWNNVILPALTALWDFITNTIIPIVQELWDQWVNVWWPAISTALENAWTIILAIWEELGRWINDNIVPWIEYLHKKWVEEIWPAIQKAIEDVWKIIRPIWEKFREYIEDKLPPALEGLQKAIETVMKGFDEAISPVHTIWKNFVDAVVNFWDWITSHKFSFDISLPDLPDWALPGSPLPIHTAWKNFAQDMNQMDIAPQVDVSEAEMLWGGGTNYNSQTTVQLAPGQDPLRALRASRHLDKLGRAG